MHDWRNYHSSTLFIDVELITFLDGRVESREYCRFVRLSYFPIFPSIAAETLRRSVSGWNKAEDVTGRWAGLIWVSGRLPGYNLKKGGGARFGGSETWWRRMPGS